jgi:predicted alpha/beta superfamily hydrolase
MTATSSDSTSHVIIYDGINLSQTKKSTMAKSTKNQSESQAENPPEQDDNRLPYEPPELRKHGKVSNVTYFLPVPIDFDGFPGRGDVS